jgi:AAHS family 4-hydroxybenzoate transporter-like MFS transporter
MTERAPANHITLPVDSGKLSNRQAWLLVLCGFVILFDGADIFMIGLAAPSIAASLKLKMASLGPVFSISQAGIMLGALLFGPAADRFGRRRLVIFTTAMFAVFTLTTVLIGNLEQLLACRFLTGLGLGGATPNVVALAAEHAPKRLRSALVAVVWAALPLGGALAGVASSLMLGPLGWQSLFYLGGLAPLVLVGALVAVRPGSPDVAGAESARVRGVPVKYLFAEGRAAGTFLLWVPFFVSFLILLTTTSRTPTLLRAGGISISLAGLAITLHSMGSVIGSASIGRLMDKLGAHKVLGIAFLANAASGAALGFVTSSFALVSVVVTLCGLCAGASQAGVIALSTAFYPAAVRSTGVGWAIAAGRFGAAVGPLMGGVLLGWNWPVYQVFLCMLAVPALCGSLCVRLLGKRHSEKRTR